MEAMKPLILVLFGLSRVLAGDCDLTGTWTDNHGNVATIVQTGTVLNVTSATPGTGWTQAPGTVNGSTVYVAFQPPATLTGEVSADCVTIQWSNGVTWLQGSDVKYVHVVYMTHLDVGFTNFADNVCDLYFDQWFLNALQTAEALRARNGSEQFIYTSHPWLVAEYLDGRAGCTTQTRTPAQVEELEAAIGRGDVQWHAMPFNYFVELVDPDLFEYGLTIREDLNALYNQTHGSVCAKHTDVTGMTRSVIPLFAAHGVQAIHLGYNSACKTPQVPPVFVWSHPETGTELITMVENNYGSRIVLPGFAHALVFLYSVDNTSPPSADDVVSFWADLRKQYPNATILASSLDAFAAELLTIKDTLPVITSELGDSWLYGSPADPYKMAAFREARRLAAEYKARGDADLIPPSFDRRILVVPEHNYGLSIGQYLPALRTETGNWSNPAFHAVMGRSDYLQIEAGWAEKRDFLVPQGDAGAFSLPIASRAFEDELRSRLAALQSPERPDLSRHKLVQPSDVFQCTFFNISFNSTDGSIAMLEDLKLNKPWASPSNALGQFRYQTFTLEDFNVFNAEYNPGCGPPCGDFSKQGMDSANPVHATWFASLVSARRSRDAACSFVMELALDAETYTKYGAPQTLLLNVTLPDDQPIVNVQLSWFNKTATRLAEAMWISFDPVVSNSSAWVMDVLGSPVSPLDVAVDGTRHIHAVWSGVTHEDPAGADLFLQSWDVSVASPGDPDHLLNYDGASQPDMTGGWHFNLYNNLWGTAFPQWYSQDGLARFTFSPQYDS